MMKKLPALLLLLTTLFLTTFLGGCSDSRPDNDQTTALQIVTDSFSAYDWTKNIIGDADIKLTLLGDNGADIHSYQPNARDFAMIADCDMFIYIGGESDSWVTDAVEQTATSAYAMPLLTVIADNMPLLTVNDENISADDEHDHDHADGLELDEHIWLSLKNAVICTDAIAEKLAEIDPDNAAAYRTNAAAYIEKLNALDSEYQAAIDTAAFNTLLVADRFPFAYLVNDYDLNWYAAYKGCSAETGASFETVKFLSEKLTELQLPAVLTCEKSDNSLAETILSTAKVSDTEIIALNSLQSVTAEEIADGKTYLKVMQENLSALSAALNY